MTLGFAAGTWFGDRPVVAVASDTRFTLRTPPGVVSRADVGVKTYELGGRCALVASGAARPPIMAADLTRTTVETNNWKSPERKVNFLDTVRMFSYFLRQTASADEPASEVAVAGFLEDGCPCLAQVIVSPTLNRASFLSVPKDATMLLPVGDPDGKVLLLRATQAAKREGLPRLGTPLSVLLYMAKHSGAFQSIGGGLAAGFCDVENERFRWPAIEVDGRRYLRGIDITAAYRPTWPAPEVIDYDEAWCASLDQRVAHMDNDIAASEPQGSAPGFDITAIDPATVFLSHVEPPEWGNGSIQFSGRLP